MECEWNEWGVGWWRGSGAFSESSAVVAGEGEGVSGDRVVGGEELGTVVDVARRAPLRLPPPAARGEKEASKQVQIQHGDTEARRSKAREKEAGKEDGVWPNCFAFRARWGGGIGLAG